MVVVFLGVDKTFKNHRFIVIFLTFFATWGSEEVQISTKNTLIILRFRPSSLNEMIYELPGFDAYIL